MYKHLKNQYNIHRTLNFSVPRQKNLPDKDLSCHFSQHPPQKLHSQSPGLFLNLLQDFF